MGWTPPYAALFAWLDGRGAAADRRRGAGIQAVDAGASGRRRGPDQGGGRARSLCRRMEMGRHPGADIRDAGRRAALLALRGRCLQCLSRSGRQCGLSGCPGRRAAGQAGGRGRLVQRPAAAPQPQDGHRAHARGLSRPSCISTIYCSMATRICAAAVHRASGAARSVLARERPTRMDVSPLVEVGDLEDLERLRGGVRGTPIEGLMLKRKDSPYLAGRPKGLWWKWKRDALTLDVVLMYAQRGHGKRSSFYSDFTFGAWRDGQAGPELVPVGKAYSGYTDAELLLLDRWIRDHTTKRYGPVREVTAGLVFEVAFNSVQRSTRHKSGRRDALPAHPPNPVGQARRRSRPSRIPGRDDRLGANRQGRVPRSLQPGCARDPVTGVGRKTWTRRVPAIAVVGACAADGRGNDL